MIPQTDYVKNYWRGRHPLSHVVWLDLFALSMLLSVLMDLVPQPLSIVEVTLILLVLNIIFVWQFTGAIRTIQRAFKSRSDIVMIAFLSFTLAIVSAVSLWRCIELLYPETAQEQIITKTPILQLDVSDHGRIIHLTGAIHYPLRASFLSTLDNNKDIQTVSLSSSGGNVFAARAMALKIAELGLNTHVDKDCFSACTLIFLAGKDRTIGKTAQLGFHSYATNLVITSVTLDIQEQTNKDKKYLMSRGVSNDFIQKAYSTPSVKIWIPTQQELQDAGVLAPTIPR